MSQADRDAQATAPKQPMSAWAGFRAWLYDGRELWRESRQPVLLFALIWLLSAAYIIATGMASDLPSALYRVLQVIILQTDGKLPADRVLATLYFLIPLVAVFALLPTVLPFARYLFVKKDRQQPWQVALASTYADHVIVCGLGRVGSRVVARLVSLGERVVVIQRDWDGEFVQQVLSMRVPVIVGDATNADVLTQAGVKRARAVVAVVDGDLTDIDIALAARKLRPDLRVILRAFSEAMDRNLEQTFGKNSVYSSSTLAAPTFAAATAHRGLDYALPIDSASSPYLLGVAAMTLKGLGAETMVEQWEAEYKVRVLGRDALAGRLRPGQMVAVVGRLPNVEAARMRFEGGFEPRNWTEGELIIVTGLGKVAFRVVDWLRAYRYRPQIAVILRPQDTRPDLLSRLDAMGITQVYTGDARDANVLKAAGIERAVALASVTSDDQQNLQVALEARQLNPNIHIVLRVFSTALADNMNALFNIRTAYSTSDLSSATLAAAGAVGGIERAFMTDRGAFASRTVSVRTGDQYVGRTLSHLRAVDAMLGVWMRRGMTEYAVPDLGTTLQPDDQIVFVSRIGREQ